jgi:hypothetical protein
MINYHNLTDNQLMDKESSFEDLAEWAPNQKCLDACLLELSLISEVMQERRAEGRCL